MIDESVWYLTGPWDPVQVRRGDALGFRAGSDHFADLLAPGLSNSTSDARWISILAWCLKWSHVAWQKAGSQTLTSQEAQAARYAWLRPLELLWVDRALESGRPLGQLRGRKSIERWRKAERGHCNFAMTTDQFRRYRHVGIYGAYRVVFRTMPGLTTGDGWTPSGMGLRLAEWVNDGLPRGARLDAQRFDVRTQWGRWLGEEAEYWVRHGWPGAGTFASRGPLPTPDGDVSSPLPEPERAILADVLFELSSVRRVTAEVLAGVRVDQDHSDVCDHLAGSEKLALYLGSESLAPLPLFSRFADAAMHAMRGAWEELVAAGEQAPQPVEVRKLAKASLVADRLERVQELGAAWLQSPTRAGFQHGSVPTHLAQAIVTARTPTARLLALVRHHDCHGGGRRWFREQSGSLVPLVADSGIAASDYRFRLSALCRLSAQCGVSRMKGALAAVGRTDQVRDDEGDML